MTLNHKKIIFLKTSNLKVYRNGETHGMSMLSTSFMEHLPKPSHSTVRQVSSHSQFMDNNTQFREEKLAEHI